MNSIRKAIYAIAILLMAVTSHSAYAQCDNVTVNVTYGNSTCAANGWIKVKLTGSDVGNIDMEHFQIRVDNGEGIHSFSEVLNDSVTGLAPGTWTVEVRAFCNQSSSWGIYRASRTVTITSNYQMMIATLGTPRPTLKCPGSKTGNIPVAITANTGLSPFTITMISTPAGYTGPTTRTITRRYTWQDITIDIDSLPAGNYSFSVSDACSATQVFNNVTVGTMTESPRSVLVSSSFYSQTNSNYIQTDCNTVTIVRSYTTSMSQYEQYYYYSYLYKYYDLGIKPEDGTIEWFSGDTVRNYYINYRMSNTIKNMRGKRFIVYFRTKEAPYCTDSITTITMNNYYYLNPAYQDLKCNSLSVLVKTYGQYSSSSIMCYPITYTIKDASNNVITTGSLPKFDSVDTVKNVPYGSKIEFSDAEAETGTSSVWGSHMTPYISYSSQNYTHGDTIINGCKYYKTYLYLSYSSLDKVPVGTRFRYIDGPVGAPTPVNADFVTTADYKYSSVYPYAPDPKNSSNSIYQYFPTGTYRFEVTLANDGGPCKPDTISTTISNNVVCDLSYTSTESCDGMIITPTAQFKYEYISYRPSTGKYDSIYISNQTPYFWIQDYPSGAPISQEVVTLGGTLRLPSNGQYTITATNSNGRYTGWDTLRINYVKPNFELDPSVTSSYFCEGATIGFIRVKGMGGSGNYEYDLIDGGTVVESNTTGTFDYGTAGSTYTVRLKDADCNRYYDQEVTLANLGIAQIAFSDPASGIYCLEDTIKLRCLTLGETTYKWSGPGITAANQNDQNPRILASDPSVGVGTHTYTIKVTPESCGFEMTQYVTVTVYDCSGAQDDSLVVIKNSSGIADVLANDKVTGSCIPIITPNVTVGPKKGSYSLINRQIKYTPNNNYYGLDSLTYCITCNATTTCAKLRMFVLDMNKSAILDTVGAVTNNGLLGNPVAVLYTDRVIYTVKAANASLVSGAVEIRDTIPAYMKYLDNTATTAGFLGKTQTSAVNPPVRDVLRWKYTGIPAMDYKTVTYKATPESGSCASQPLFINSAYIVLDDTALYTNSTYHQGAGVAIVTFSAMLHGEVYGGETQAVDFNTTARSGVLVAPDEGYVFTGWSHDEYVSLKGDIIPAQSGIMNYDTLTIYGNVELMANFVRTDEVANENVSDAAVETHERTSKIWASGQNLYVQVKESGSVIRIYNTEGTLIRQLPAVSEGTTTIQLPRGIYIVTVNGNIGEKVRIE